MTHPKNSGEHNKQLQCDEEEGFNSTRPLLFYDTFTYSYLGLFLYEITWRCALSVSFRRKAAKVAIVYDRKSVHNITVFDY
jgi:hypothetical protein